MCLIPRSTALYGLVCTNTSRQHCLKQLYVSVIRKANCVSDSPLHSWSITPIMYPAAFYFRVASTAYVSLIVLNLFVGITATVTTFILQLFPDDKVNI